MAGKLTPEDTSFAKDGKSAFRTDARVRSWRSSAAFSRVCLLLLGHRKLESTVCYLGIEIDDALALSEQVDL